MAKLDRLIRDMGSELQGYRLGAKRSREVAREIGLLNRVVAKAARDLTLADSAAGRNGGERRRHKKRLPW